MRMLLSSLTDFNFVIDFLVIPVGGVREGLKHVRAYSYFFFVSDTTNYM